MSTDYERVLLGQVLNRPSVIDDQAVTVEMFTTADNRAIFGAIEKARNEYRRADTVSIGDVLMKSGHGDLVATMAGIEFTSAANAEYYATQLREKMRRESLAASLSAGLESLKDHTKTTAELSDVIMGAITSSIHQIPEPEAPTMHNVILPYLSTVSKRIEERRHGSKRFVQFGVPPLDNIITEIRPGEVIVIAGRPGAGKTALALQMVRYSAVVSHKPAAFFSMEMRRDEVLDRIIAQTKAATVSSLRGGYLRDDELAASETEANEMYDAPLSIYDGAQSLPLIRSRIRREKAVNNLEVACVDYLGLIDLGTSGKVPRWERIGEVSRTLKLLALDLGIVIVEVVQMNREADGVEPTLGVLRDSGAIEQDADRVVMLHATAEKVDGKNDEPRQVSAIVAKNRHGPCGKTLLSFDGQHVLFGAEATVHEEKPAVIKIGKPAEENPWKQIEGLL